MDQRYTDDKELVDIVNEKDDIIGQNTRNSVHKDPSLIHRSITVLIFVNNKLLLQKRSYTKDTYPGYWTSSCTGHVSSGDSYENAAMREMTEELGIIPSLPLQYIRKDLLRMPTETEVMTTFRYDTNDRIVPNKSEIESCQLFTITLSLAKKILSLPITPDLRFLTIHYISTLIK